MRYVKTISALLILSTLTGAYDYTYKLGSEYNYTQIYWRDKSFELVGYRQFCEALYQEYFELNETLTGNARIQEGKYWTPENPCTYRDYFTYIDWQANETIRQYELEKQLTTKAPNMLERILSWIQRQFRKLLGIDASTDELATQNQLMRQELCRLNNNYTWCG